MSKISLADQELERMIHEISTMGQDLGKAEADYERLVYEMKYEVRKPYSEPFQR